MRPVVFAIFAGAVLSPLPAAAQGDDAAYCAQLAQLVTRYVANGTAQGAGTVDLDTKTAIDNCNKGNTAAGIPVLERKLRAGGFTLPRRS